MRASSSDSVTETGKGPATSMVPVLPSTQSAETSETIFQVECATQFGEEVCVVGSAECLGRWDPSRAIRMQTNAEIFPLWMSKPIFGLNKEVANVDYKFIIAKQCGNYVW